MKKFIAAAAAKRRGHANGAGNDRGVRFSRVSGRGISRNRNWNAGLTEGRGSGAGGGGRHVHPNDLVNGGNNDNRGFIFGAGGAQRHLDRNFSQRPREEEEEGYRRQQEGHNIPVVDPTEKETNLVVHSTPTNEAQGKRKNNGDRLLTQMETFNMKIDHRRDSSPFILLPRVSRAHDFPDGDSRKASRNDERDFHGDRGDNGTRGGGGEGGESDAEGPPAGKRPPRRNRRSPKNGAGDEEEGNIDWQAPDGGQAGGPDNGNRTKFRRNVPPYYKVFELNSRFFLSGLGMITLLNIFLATIAVITGCESDPAVLVRFAESHAHIAFLAIVLIILIVKYSLYLFHMKPLNRRMEIAHLLFFIVILITTGLYANWILNKLPEEVHNALDIRLPCARTGNAHKIQPAPKEQEKNLKISGGETAQKNWYVCSLISSTALAGVTCLVFSCLLLCGLLANVIHAFLGIQNDIDITS